MRIQRKRGDEYWRFDPLSQMVQKPNNFFTDTQIWGGKLLSPWDITPRKRMNNDEAFQMMDCLLNLSGVLVSILNFFYTHTFLPNSYRNFIFVSRNPSTYSRWVCKYPSWQLLNLLRQWSPANVTEWQDAGSASTAEVRMWVPLYHSFYLLAPHHAGAHLSRPFSALGRKRKQVL